MIDLVVAILAGLALLAIIVIVGRKFPMLASINTSTIPAERHQELKSKLMEDRLRRKLRGYATALGRGLQPLGAKTGRLLRTWYDRLLELERRYRAKVVHERTTTTPEQQAKQGVTRDTIVAEAEAAYHAGEYADAERKAIEAISFDPKHVPAYRVLADVAIEQRNFELARETLQFMIERLHVEDDEVYADLGQVASGEGKLDEAKQDFERSITLNANVAQHYLDLCRVELSLGDSAAAFESCRKAVGLEPNNPKFLDALVEASIIAGKRDWAAETLEKLRTVNPENQKIAELSARIEQLPPGRVRRSAR